ncbi:MAG: pyruvate dehydrogenase complex dihydrolipoamide acetyltransferase [Gemmatimonadota bacterium]
MATKVHMEALSPTMEEGQLVKWLKSEGDTVENGELLAEIETDKATMELVARGAGVLRKILLGEGSTAAVGEVIAVIGEEDEDISALLPATSGKKSEAADKADAAEGSGSKKEDDSDEEPDSEEAADSDEDDASPKKDAAAKKTAEKAEGGSESSDASADDARSASSAASPDGRVKASPLARRLAADEGLELASIQGSGPGGRIVKRDVEKAAQEAPAAAAPGAPSLAPRLSVPDSADDVRDVPLTQMRKTIAKRLVESIGPVPHFFLTIDVDMSRAVAARGRVNALLEGTGVKVSYNDIVLKSTAAALRRHPECNAHWGGDHIRQFNRVHLGVAVAIEDGLITPIIRDAHLKGLAEIATEVRELAGRAREKKLKPEEYTGATFSVSNLGMFGIEEFTAVINPPEAGILAVGALEERAVVVKGEVQVQPRMKITMSCDHRVIDGALGAGFLRTLKAILEEPLTALV